MLCCLTQVADLKKEISRAYGVLTDEGIALRGLFLIDREGVVQHATINNLACGRSVDETLRTLQAIQYVQDNPDEVSSGHGTWALSERVTVQGPCQKYW